ncbi:hypothetical protein psal_cds_389 [Pandoravirus salinus]|uniref:C962R-like N-terminal AEP domain-containing protein n=1 Tax=Pandoravirus salinus TaxID=1349410 RepID=S4VU85_9VIRU|nr:hypothetical protein psal_cds_389 [Pandoravirus salinus]AGO84079.1 hypothetical protein psal_cds_389 [Pandoravirus salinus]
MDLSMNLLRMNRTAASAGGTNRADPLKALADARGGVRPSAVNETIAAVRADMDACATTSAVASDAAATAAAKKDGVGLAPSPSEMHRRFRDPDPLATSVLKDFLGRRGCLVKRAARKAGASEPTARPTTAFLKDGWGGGVVSVPDEDYAAFLDAYGDDVNRGVRHAICEQRSAVFRMHLDIDLSVPRAADRRAVLTLVRLIQAITARFFPGASRHSLLAVIVLAAQEKPLGDGRGVKQGIHIVMPNLYVNWRQALDMRECYVTLLKRAYGPDARGWAAGDPPARSADPETELQAANADVADRAADCTWEKVIDHNVFTFNGLRMPYSHNVIRCPTCKGAKPRATASAGSVPCAGPCNGTGKCWEPRWYEPVACLDGDGAEDRMAFDHMAGNPHYCLLRTSIRCRADQVVSPGWTCFAGAPRCNVAALDPAWHKYQERLAGAGGATGAGGRSVPNTVPPDDPRFARMATLIRAKGHAPHARVDVHSIRRDKRGNYYIVQVDGEGSRACLNMPPEPGSGALCGEHDNARVFYQLSRAGLVQKCNCRCPHDRPRRLYTTCNNYRSAPIAISHEDRAFFFDNGAVAVAVNGATNNGNSSGRTVNNNNSANNSANNTHVVGGAGMAVTMPPTRLPPTLFSGGADRPDAIMARIGNMMASFRRPSSNMPVVPAAPSPPALVKRARTDAGP